MRKLLLILCTSVSLSIGTSCSGELSAQNGSKYAGQEIREIKSLSKSDIDELRAGKGWGLAKAAELNGVPGPAHLLELKKEIELSGKQLEEIERLFEEMKKEAIPLGVKLIKLEKELDDGFANKTINRETLAKLLDQIAGVRGELRFVHLSVHLKTPKILSPNQIEKYNELRGYSSKDPCSEVPAGHDPVLWKRHNNCS